MKDYILYSDIDNKESCIVEVLNEGLGALMSVEENLIRDGYVITEILDYGKFIRCTKQYYIEAEE